jgi:hypothetical protein
MILTPPSLRSPLNRGAFSLLHGHYTLLLTVFKQFCPKTFQNLLANYNNNRVLIQVMVCFHWWIETGYEYAWYRRAFAEHPPLADVDAGEVGSGGRRESRKVSGIETGKIGRPHFGTLGKLVRALGVAPEELLDSLAPVEQQDSAPLSLGGRESGEGESKVGLRTLPSKASIPSLAGWMLSKSVSRGSTRIFLKAVSKGGS